MTPNKNQNLSYTWMQIIYITMRCLNFYQQAYSKEERINPKESDLIKYTTNCSKGYVLEVNIEYPKELRELRNDYPLAPDKIEIKENMLPSYQFKVTDLYNIPIGNVKKGMSNFFEK